MNLASTGTEMDFLSQPVNQLQETNMVEIFWNALYLLLMYEKCIKIISQGFVFQGLPFLSVQTSALKTYSVKLMFDTETKEKALQFSQQPSEARRHCPPPRTLLSHSDFSQSAKVSKVSNELCASSCPSRFLRNLVFLHKCMMQAFKGSGHENI